MVSETSTARFAQAILVVDGDQYAAQTMAYLLELQGHAVTVAYDGVAALQAAERRSPDVVLLDIGLPKLDGWQVAKALRSRPGAKQPLIIAMTRYNDTEARIRSYAAGIDLYLLKPVDIEGWLPLFQSHAVLTQTESLLALCDQDRVSHLAQKY
jgi:DNA-binding response OmpR family regulator